MNDSAASTICVFAQGEALARLAVAGGTTGAPFQSAAWLESWLAAMGGLPDFRLVEISSAQGITLLPVSVVQQGGVRFACKAGGGHASFFTPQRSGTPEPLSVETLKAAARALNLDALVLTDCPRAWGGVTLFDAGLPASPDIARGVTLSPGAALYTGEAGKKLRAKGRKLASLGALTQGFLAGDEAKAALEAMLGWKAAQFAARGIADPFASAQMQQFLMAGLAKGALRLFALKLEDRPLAALVLAQAGTYASGMAIAYDPAPEIARFGPGDVLIGRLIEVLAGEGVTGFDLGVGEARYKRLHCPEAMAMADVYAAASLKGAGFIAAHALARRAKGALKRNESAFAALSTLRAKLLGRPPGEA